MGGMPRVSIGHILPGAGYVAVGVWHMFGHIKLSAQRPESYVAPVWFPVPGARYLELVLIIAGSAVEFAMEMFVGHSSLLPFDADGSVPSDRLHNHEHALICAGLGVYAAAALHLDRAGVRDRDRDMLSLLLVGAAFAQELLVFHFHSTDHAGVEGQFHWLLQLVVAACLATALLGVALPGSLAVSLVRSACVAFHGVWLIVTGAMVWVPSLVPKGCSPEREDGRDTVRCRSAASLHRAKALANLQFGWYLTFMTVFVVALYLYVSGKYSAEAAAYSPLRKAGDEEEEEDHKCAAPRCCGDVRGFASLEIEV